MFLSTLRKLQILIFLPFAAGPLWSQSPFEGKPIVAVEYQPSLQPLDPRDMERVQVLHPGSPLRSADVADCIERMFATGRYTDIQVDAEPSGNGVVVRFVTKEARFIGHIEPTGKISHPPSS